MAVGMMRALGDLATRMGISGKLGQTYKGDRDLYTTFGYRRDPDFNTYLDYYLRGDIAARVVDMAPKASWRHAPIVRAYGDDGGAFGDTIAMLDDRVRCWHHLSRLDEISGIGQFGVVLIGTRGGPVTQEPVGLTSPEDIMYLRAYHQGSVEIKEWEEDTTSSRYGLPKVYEIQMQGTTTDSSSRTMTNPSLLVPWQRIIHVVEQTIEDQVYGQPRLARVLNRVDDLSKVLGASAELYWQNIAGIWHANVGSDIDVSDEDLEAFEDDILAARHGLTRLIQTRGVDLDAITGAPVDPRGVYDSLRQVISAAADIPERVLFGSERGQLAADQDQREWQARIASRQEQHVEPNIVREFIDRLIDLGALETPVDGYDVMWHPIDAPSTADRAETAQKFADAIAKVAPAGAADLVMPSWEFRQHVLGLDPVPPEMPEGFDLMIDDEED